MKKWATLLLAALLLLSMGATAFAEEDAGVRKGDVVFLGHWKDAPIRWLVLDPDATNAGGEGMFLLSEKTLTNQGVIYSWSKSVWQGGEGQRWCSDLLGSAFTEAEQAVIPAVSKSEEAFQQYGLNWGPVALEEEQVFFPSAMELRDYISPNVGNPDLSASYVGNGKITYYWLRTPHAAGSDSAGLVIENGRVQAFPVYGSWGARPAANLGGEGLLYLAANERVIAPCDPGPMPGADNGEWKATVVDPEIRIRVEDARFTDGALNVRVSGAPKGAWISVLARDAEGKNVAYGCIAKAEGGEEEIRFAPQLPDGGSLSLFAELDNGPGSSNTASELCPLSWEEPAETPEAQPAEAEEPSAEEVSGDENSVPAVQDASSAAAAAVMGTAFRRTLWLFGIVFGLFSVAAVVLAVRQAKLHADDPEDWDEEDEDDWE